MKASLQESLDPYDGHNMAKFSKSLRGADGPRGGEAVSQNNANRHESAFRRGNSAKPSMSHDGVPFTEGHLTHDEKKALYAVFRSIDRDGNDKIHFDEIRRVYGGDANGLFHLLDANHDGQVTLHFNLQDPFDD